MAQVEPKPLMSTCAAALLGGVLLLFAGTLVAVTPLSARINNANDEYFLNGERLGAIPTFKVERLGEPFLAPARQLGNLTDLDGLNNITGSSGGGSTFTKAGAGVGGGSALLQLLITLCLSCVYKQWVVDPMGKFPEVAPSAPPEGYDDFAFGLCDCITNPHMCLFICCCSPLRIAHSNEIAGICNGFWVTLLSWFCCTAFCSQCLGPLCLSYYFRYALKVKMGINTSFMDCIMAVCPCTAACAIGQQALQVDDAMGFKYQCCFKAVPADGPLE